VSVNIGLVLEKPLSFTSHSNTGCVYHNCACVLEPHKFLGAFTNILDGVQGCQKVVPGPVSLGLRATKVVSYDRRVDNKQKRWSY
jgi:hypothetical protein